MTTVLTLTGISAFLFCLSLCDMIYINAERMWKVTSRWLTHKRNYILGRVGEHCE